MVLLFLVSTTAVLIWVAGRANEAMRSFDTIPGASGGSSPTVGPLADLLGTDPRPGLAELARVSGGVDRAAEVVLYPGYVVAELEDGTIPGDQLVRWVVYPGRPTREPDPVRRRPEDLAASWFDLSTVDWPAVPALVRRAVVEVATTGLPDGEVSHVIVGRFLPWDEAVNIRVYVRSPAGDAYVRFATTGELIEVVG